jgi:AcrR family transcriptional regulator
MVQRKKDTPLDEPALITPAADMLSLSTDEARHERSDAAENRRRILAVAERLFTELGVETVCMNQIARAAGVGQGTLYRRYSDKGELCMALLDSQMSAFQDEVLSTLREMTHKKRRPLEQLEWFLDGLVHFSERHGPLLTAARSELRSAGHENLTQRSAPFAWMRITVIGLLTAGARTGELRADLDAPVIADLLLSALHPQQLLALRQGPTAHSITRISAAMRQIVRGLAA